MELTIKQKLMSTAEIRADLIKRIANLDERFLEAMHLMAVAYDSKSEDPIIGYDIDGKPKYASVMKAIYDEEVRAAREDGKFITIEELEKEMETW